MAQNQYAELDAHLAGLHLGKLIPENDVRLMCEKAKEILAAESNVVPVRAPVTIVRARAGAPRVRRCWDERCARGAAACAQRRAGRVNSSRARGFGRCVCVCVSTPRSLAPHARAARLTRRARAARWATSTGSSQTCWS
jgi:hypothetical protein